MIQILLIRIIFSRITTLEEGQVCNIIPCGFTDYQSNPYQYGTQDYGDLSQVSDFTFTFQVLLGVQQYQTFVFSLLNELTSGFEYKLYIDSLSSAQINFVLDSLIMQTSILLPSRGWFLIAISSQSLMVSNFQTSTTITNSFDYQTYHKFNLFQQDSTNYWNGLGCCVVMYYGINLIDSNNLQFNPFMYNNYRKPELMVHLNIQELSQPKITADYSLYKNIAKLGDEFAFQDDDPILQETGGLLFNSSQFIVIENFKYNLYFTFEFRIILSSTFLSDVILADFQKTGQRVIIYIKGNKFNLQFGNQNKTFTYQEYPVIHFSITLVRPNVNVNQYNVLFNQYQNGDIISTQFENMVISSARLQSALGRFYIGSKQNQFQINEYFILLIFRHYQGFFIDQAQIMNPLCKLYLADRCIKCNPYYYLSIFDDQQCIQVNDNTIAQTFSQKYDQLIRKCESKCGTCLDSDPSICLTCNGNNRSNPPLCNCPAQYFDDYVHSDCKQFIADRAFETGKTTVRCNSIGTSQNSIITSQNSYTSVPNILVFLNSIYNPCDNQQVLYQIRNINNQLSNLQFTIETLCICVGQVFQYQWSIDNGLNQKVFIQQNTYNIVQSYSLEIDINIQEGVQYNHILSSVLGWQFTLSSDYLIPYVFVQNYQTDQEDILDYQFYGLDLLKLTVNVFYTNFFTINVHQEGLFNNYITQNMPAIDKSIQYIIILQELQNDEYDDISYQLDQKERNPRMISKINSTLVFAAFQCKDQLKSCDFYEYYNLNCIVSSICTCDTIGYYYNQSMFCQKCDQNCYQCQSQSNYCIACYPNSNALLLNNTCTCLQQQYFYKNNTCKDCPPLCLTCTQMNYCQSCKYNSFLYNQVCQCLEGYYLSTTDKICLKCNNLCESCLDSSSCSICKQNTYLFQGQCLCDRCYYYNSNQCQLCQLEDSVSRVSCQFSQCKSQINFYCNDENIIPNDGCNNNLIQPYYGCQNIDDPNEFVCYNCQNQCKNCIIQLNLKYCLECDQGYFNSNYDCIKCYDPSCIFCNSIYNCQICNNNLVPILGYCLQCDKGYYSENSMCKNICGDGIKTIEEQCDDGNYQSYDGCSDCLIKENFICYEQSQMSICKISFPPNLYLDVLEKKVNNQYYIIIKSDQEIIFTQISTNIYLNNKLDNSVLESQNFTQNNMLQIFNYQGYLLLANNFNSISVRIQFIGKISNQYNQSFVKNYIEFELTDIMILMEQEQNSVQIISKMVGVSAQITICISIMMVFVNGLTSLLGQINILNIFQYVQFLIIEFPPNLLQFIQSFQSYNIIQYFYNSEFLINIIQITLPYQKPDEIFYKKGINAFFLYNIQSYIFCLLLFYLVKYLQRILILIFQKIYFSLPLDNNNAIKFKKILKIVSIISYRSQREQDQYGIIKLNQAMAYQIIFAILLQLKQPIQFEIKFIIPYILALITMMLYIRIILLSTQKIDENIKKQLMIQSYLINIFKLTEPIIYIFTLVYNQSFPIQQILLISFHQIITLVFTIYFMPYKKTLLNYEFISQQIGLFINHLSFILYIYNPTQQNNINIGWVQILIFFMLIISSLMLELYMAIQYVIHLYKKITIMQKDQY